MGLVAFLSSVWTAAFQPQSHHCHDLSQSTSPHLATIKKASTLEPKAKHGMISGYPDSPRTPKRVTFTISSQLYAWLEAMALSHNYGSVHKSVRHLLAWACTDCEDDMQWLFGTVHEIPACLDFYFGREHTPEASSIAGKQVYSRSSPADPVTLDARLTDSLYHWVNDCVRRYDLEGPSDVLEAVCRCAIGQGAGDDIFESDTSWHDLPRCTVQLYHDLGIIRFSASGESMGFSAKYGCNR